MNKNIRDLLADCRIELRTLMRDFHKSELCRRIDEARVELARDDAPETATAVAVLATAAVSTDRVAQAWRLRAPGQDSVSIRMKDGGATGLRSVAEAFDRAGRPAGKATS